MSLRHDQYISSALIAAMLLLSGLSLPMTSLHAPGSVLLIQKPAVVIPFVSETVSKPQVTALAAIVIDEASAATIFEQNADVQFSPASTTKLMTALLARQLYQLDAAITVPEIVAALDGTKMGITPGERISVEALLKGTLMQSGNDAAMTLAAAHPLGVTGFVADMNKKAVELKLNHSSFRNPVGYDAAEHQVSSRDLALLAREVMRDPVLRKIVGTPREVVTDTTGAQTYNLVSTHKLLGVDPSVIGVKTGTTEEAGEVLITQFQSSDQSILVVVMGSKDRYSDTRALMEYVRQAVKWNTVNSAKPLDTISAQ